MPGRAGATGTKFRITLGLPVAATMNCADNSGAKNLYIISVACKLRLAHANFFLSLYFLYLAFFLFGTLFFLLFSLSIYMLWTWPFGLSIQGVQMQSE